MPELPRRKLGLVSCCGEEMPEGTIARLATLRVLESLRRGDTVTICLPLFLAGGEGDRAFARCNPTITIDGCEKRCAAKGTARYSAEPAASIVVTELCPKPPGGFGTTRRLSNSAMDAVGVVAEEIVRNIDRLLGRGRDGIADKAVDQLAAARGAPLTATCSCGSGTPVTVLAIAGRRVEVLALPLIFDMFLRSGKTPGAATSVELLETVRLYNQVPEIEQAAWQETIQKEYAGYFAREAR